MRLRAHKPEYDQVDGEYVVPIRFSRDLVHNLLAGWCPFGVGFAHLRDRGDKTFDIFLRGGSAMREDLNMVRLDAVQVELMASLDLALKVKDYEDDVPDELVEAADKVLEHLKIVAD